MLVVDSNTPICYTNEKEKLLRTITFYSTKSCPNCMVMKRWVNDLHLNVDYVTLDSDSPEVERCKISSVPTIIVREEDVEVSRITGAHTLAALKSFFINSGVLK